MSGTSEKKSSRRRRLDGVDGAEGGGEDGAGQAGRGGVGKQAEGRRWDAMGITSAEAAGRGRAGGS